MEQTLNLLGAIDSKIKRNHNYPNKLQSLSLKERLHFKKASRYPYAKALDFSQSQYSQFPKWLIEKDGFIDFMYKNYQKKLMSIPKICQLEKRDYNQKQFLSLYLKKVDIFRNLPSTVNDIIVENLKTKYYKVGDIIHLGNQVPDFMGVIYIGSVTYRNSKRTVERQKNQTILIQAFHNKIHPQVIAKQETIILSIDKQIYTSINEKLRQFFQKSQRDQVGDLLKSQFFKELHIKDIKAKNFYKDLQLEFYFSNEVIEEAGTDAQKFYIIFQGQIQQQNHIYIRQHNKWPLANHRWQIRAVYNSYNKSQKLKQLNFFGDEQILDKLKFRSKFIASSWVIVFSMGAEKFKNHLSDEDLKRLKKYRAEHVDIDYNDFENKVRKGVRSLTEKKKIILKAINTTLIKPELSPRKMVLIDNFKRSMIEKQLFQGKTMSY